MVSGELARQDRQTARQVRHKFFSPYLKLCIKGKPVTMLFGLTLEEWSYAATTVSVAGAAIAFCLNVRGQMRQRSIDNCIRYLEHHDTLFAENSYLRSNVLSMENGSFKRDASNADMEKAFREMLSNFEKLALLHKAGGAPSSINAYMLGYFSKHVCSAVNDREKAEPYWDLALEFIAETKKAAEQFDALGKSERLKYIAKNHF